MIKGVLLFCVSMFACSPNTAFDRLDTEMIYESREECIETLVHGAEVAAAFNPEKFEGKYLQIRCWETI